jgi:hypothetical protein
VPPRPLPYPLRNAAQIEGLGDELPSPFEIVQGLENGVKLPFTLLLTLEEYVMLSSALDVGRDIAYPNEQFLVWDLWVSRQMDICELIANCLNDENSPANAAARNIANKSNGNGANGNAPFYNPDNPESDENLVGENGAGCTYDEIYGACVSVIQQMHQNTLDFFDQLNLVASNKDKAKALIASVPYVGTLAADTIVETVIAINTTIQTGYNAQYTDNLAEGFSCDLFCAVKENCSLSIADVFEYMLPKIPTELSVEMTAAYRDPTAMLNLLRTIGDLTGSGYVYLMWCAQLGLGNTLNNLFGGVSLSNLIINTKLSDPSDDYLLLCTDCPTCENEEYNFVAGDELGFTPLAPSNLAVWNGYGWSAVLVGSTWVIEINKGSAVLCDTAQVSINGGRGSGSLSRLDFGSVSNTVFNYPASDLWNCSFEVASGESYIIGLNSQTFVTIDKIEIIYA